MPFDRATALVTGITGQDGGYLAEQLAAGGYAIHGLVNEDPADALEVPHLKALGAQLSVHHADLADLPSVTTVLDAVEPDLLFNLGGLSSVAASWHDPVRTLDVNARSVLGMLEHLRARQERGAPRTRFIQASSAEVFAGSAVHGRITEQAAVTPTNPYGVAKAVAHQAVGMYRAQGLHATSLVLFNHESPRRPHHFVTRKITAGVAAIASGRADHLALGNLAVHRDWGWAPDYTAAMLLAAQSDEPDDYVVATGESHSLSDLVATAFARVGITEWRKLVTIDQASLRPADSPVLTGDATRIRTRLAWAPTVTFSEMVAAMVDHDLVQIGSAAPDARLEEG